MEIMIRVAFVATIATLSAPVSAAVIDQSGLVDPAGFPLQYSVVVTQPSGFSRWQAQSVTAGLTGLVSRIDLQATPFDGARSLLLSLGYGEVTDAGFTLLATISFDRAGMASAAELDAGLLTEIDTSSLGFSVTVGQVFTIMLEAEYDAAANNRFGWSFGNDIGGGDVGNGADYAGGVNRISDDFGVTWSQTGFDRGFRTWVDAGAVPEPASWAMMILGFGAVGLVARRRAILA